MAQVRKVCDFSQYVYLWALASLHSCAMSSTALPTALTKPNPWYHVMCILQGLYACTRQTKDKHAIRDNMKPRPFFSPYQPLLYLLEVFVLWEISKNWGTAVFVLILNSLVHFKNSSEGKGAMVPMKQIKVYNLTLKSFDDSQAKSANDDALWIKCCRYFTVYSWRFS